MTKKSWKEKKKQQLLSKMKASKDDAAKEDSSGAPDTGDPAETENVAVANCGSSDQASSSTSAEVPLPLMLIVGPEKIATDLAEVFEAMMTGVDGSKIRFKTAQGLTAEDAMKWREENLVSILFVVAIADQNAKAFLNNVHQTLSTLCKKFQMSMDCIDFIVAREEPQKKTEDSLAFELLTFAKTYERPLTTIVFETGWKDDKEFTAHLEMMFLGRFRPGH